MHEKVWNTCLQLIQEKVGEQSFKTWFAPIVPLQLQDAVLTIQVPSQFFYEWLEEHYVHLLKDVINKELGDDGRLEYSVIVDQGSGRNQPYTINLPTSSAGAGPKSFGPSGPPALTSPFEVQTIDHHKWHPNLNPQYVFDTLIEGDCNRLARSAGIAVAQKPGVTSFNPLMVYGGVGLGKTHLAQAIGNSITQNFENKRVLYVSSEKFTNQFIEALKNNIIQNFTNFYLQVDVLLLDDAIAVSPAGIVARCTLLT